jgi:hypothetical protein
MPRRPRRDADESAVTDGASSGDSQAAVEHVSNPSSSGEPLADSQAAQSQSDANSPTSARRPRRKKAGTETAPPDAVETPQPSAAPAPSGRTRRRVRAVPDDAPAAVEAAPAIDSPGTAHETPQAPRPRRRGIGGRRTATEASAAVAPPDLGSGEPSTQTGSIPGLDQTEESASPHAEDAPAPSRSRRSRRGGRNRRGRDQGQETPTGEVVDTLPDTEIETPEAVETEPAPEAAAEDAPKARRPRRGGRRRPAGSGDDAEGAPDGPESASRKSELG